MKIDQHENTQAMQIHMVRLSKKVEEQKPEMPSCDICGTGPEYLLNTPTKRWDKRNKKWIHICDECYFYPDLSGN